MLRGERIRRVIGTAAAVSLLCTGAFAADAGEIVREGTIQMSCGIGGVYEREAAWDDGTQDDTVLEAVVVDGAEAEPAESAEAEKPASASGKQNTADEEQSGETAVSKWVYIAAEELSVRDAGTIAGVELGRVVEGDLVEVVAETSEWYRIRYDSGYGYICRRYTMEDDPEAAHPEEPAGDNVEEGDPNPAELEPSSMDFGTEEQEATLEAVVVTEEADTQEADTAEPDAQEADAQEADTAEPDEAGAEVKSEETAPASGEAEFRKSAEHTIDSVCTSVRRGMRSAILKGLSNG